MQTREMSIEGAFELTPVQHGDDRGLFLEWFRADVLQDLTGRSLDLRQANLSVSAAGTLRGIHFADVPPGQAKFVTCTRGAFLDVVVDLRVGSPTFGHWEGVLLDDTSRRAVFVSEGLGHAVLALEDQSCLLYLCSAEYAPDREHEVHPLDPDIGIDWPTTGRDGAALEVLLSAKDSGAPGLLEARDAGRLPRLDTVSQHLAGLR